LPYNNQHGICFEPQFFPDSMHHNNFPSPVLKAGEHLDRYIEYIF
jgi:aldose 1-epimerase